MEHFRSIHSGMLYNKPVNDSVPLSPIPRMMKLRLREVNNSHKDPGKKTVERRYKPEAYNEKGPIFYKNLELNIFQI